MGKNNLSEQHRQMLDKKQHFGFKKLSKGVASALLGLSLAYGIGTMTANTVEASELEPGTELTGDTSPDEEQPTIGETPIEPVAVENEPSLVAEQPPVEESGLTEDADTNGAVETTVASADAAVDNAVEQPEPQVDGDSVDSEKTSQVAKKISHSNFQADEGIKEEDFDFNLTPAYENEQEKYYKYNGNTWLGNLSFNYKGEQTISQTEWRVPKINSVGDSNVEFEFLSTGTLSTSSTPTHNIPFQRINVWLPNNLTCTN